MNAIGRAMRALIDLIFILLDLSRMINEANITTGDQLGFFAGRVSNDSFSDGASSANTALAANILNEVSAQDMN